MKSELTLGILSLALVLPLSTDALADGLKVDDVAPRLTIGRWFGGEAVDITKADPDDVFVISFWQSVQHYSQYYTPNLTHAQRRFKDRRVRVIAVTAEEEGAVQKYLDSGWRRQVQFTIATDRRGRTARRWKPAPDINPLVATYIVKGGRINWVGQRLENLDAHVAAACGDDAYVKAVKDYETNMEQFQAAFTAEKWDEALSVLDKMLTAKPHDTRFNIARYIVLATRKKDAKAAGACGRAILSNCEDAYALNEFSWGMLTEDMWRDCRDLTLARSVAEKAMALTDQKNAAIVDTYARALWDGGDLGGALQWQKKAVDLCKTDHSSAQYYEQIRQTLRTYQDRVNLGI